MENSANIIFQVKKILQQLIDEVASNEYKTEVAEDYVDKNCLHNIVMDSIDIDPERSQIIYYCEKCEKTFDCHQNTK
jgi:hypothetical protein